MGLEGSRGTAPQVWLRLQLPLWPAGAIPAPEKRSPRDPIFRTAENKLLLPESAPVAPRRQVNSLSLDFPICKVER